jgi:acyl CoA:acetate/3-ketoacid CoA transferase
MEFPRLCRFKRMVILLCTIRACQMTAAHIDLEKDIFAHMQFPPLVAKDLKIMDPKIFTGEIMGLKEKQENSAA